MLVPAGTAAVYCKTDGPPGQPVAVYSPAPETLYKARFWRSALLVPAFNYWVRLPVQAYMHGAGLDRKEERNAAGCV